MKKLLLLIVLPLVLSGCNTDANNEYLCYQSVKKAYPNAKVVVVPNNKFHWIVKTNDNAVVYVETMSGLTTDITNVVELFEGDK